MERRFVIAEPSDNPDAQEWFWILKPRSITETELKNRIRLIIVSDHEGWSLEDFIKEGIDILLHGEKPDPDPWEEWAAEVAKYTWAPGVALEIVANLKAALLKCPARKEK